MKQNAEREKGEKAAKATEYIQCDLRFHKGDITPEMLEILKTSWPEEAESYDDLTLCFRLEYKYKPGSALAKLAPFFHLAKGFSSNYSTSNGQKPPITSLFEAIHLHIGRK